MVKKNLVAIITPVKKNTKLSLRTYESVITQSYVNFNWIIVYDDNEEEYDFIEGITNLDQRVEIKFNHNLKKGAGNARNIGLKYAISDFITFIDSDDEWNSSFLSDSLSFLLKNRVNSCFSSYKRWIVEESRYLSNFSSNKKIISAQDILKGCDISCLTFFARNQNTLPSFGPYRARNDLVFFYQYLESYGVCHNTFMLLAQYNISKNSVSYNKLKLFKYQFLVNRIFARNSIIVSLSNTILWVIYGLNKYYLRK